MRIRRRPRDVVPPSPAPSSPGFPFSPAPPATSPRGSSSPSGSGAAAPAGLDQPPPSVPSEVDGSMKESAPLGPHLPPRSQDRQGEENEEGNDVPEKEKRRGGEDGTAHGHGSPAHLPSRYRTNADDKEQEQRREDEEKDAVAICKKGDGKGWRCKREAQRGCSLCEYHLAKLRSYGRHRSQKERTEVNPSPERTAPDVNRLQGAAPRRKRRKTELGPSVESGLAGAFYYYSGFGPLWGKRRGNRVDGKVDDPHGGASRIRHGGRLIDAAVGEGDDHYSCGGESGDRKPWKSRSLSSLP